MALNHITIMGRLTRDPEMRSAGGVPVAQFSLAVDRDFKDKNGERATDFIDIVAWRHNAEFVSRYFSKGSMAVVEGRLQMEDWTDKDGNKRRSAKVQMSNIYFGESKRDSASSGSNYSAGFSAPSPNQGSYQNQGQSGGYGDIPAIPPSSGYNSSPSGGETGSYLSAGYASSGGYDQAPPVDSYSSSSNTEQFATLSGSDEENLPF